MMISAETMAMIEGDHAARLAAVKSRVAELDGALRHAAKIEAALKTIIRHWDEFGPEHGFEETVDIARRVLAAETLETK